MGILNLTPDSFYEPSRFLHRLDTLRERVRQIKDEGAAMLDVGAFSSRPGAVEVSKEEELQRLRKGLSIILRELPEDFIVSVDTFRADVARMSCEEYGVNMINDISGGEMDKAMFATVASLQVPYILTYSRNGIGSASEGRGSEVADIVVEEFNYFSSKINRLHDMGVPDIIVDPGFGFSKSRSQDFEILSNLRHFRELGCPILAGLSRKRMVYETLGCTVGESLDGTIAVNTVALMNGASILRVHDVKAAVSAVKMVEKVK